jgi:hypothetical protein
MNKDLENLEKVIFIMNIIGTILKQMKIIHKRGFTKEEMMKYLLIICSNCFQAIKSLILAMEKLNINFEKEENEKISKEILKIPDRLILEKSRQILTLELAKVLILIIVGYNKR